LYLLIKDASKRNHLMGLTHSGAIPERFWFKISSISVSKKEQNFPCKKIDSFKNLKVKYCSGRARFYDPELNTWIAGQAEYLVIDESVDPNKFASEILRDFIELANTYLPVSHKVSLSQLTKKKIN